jgi:hypothetical protein
MDRVSLEDGLRQANARVAAGQQALLEQRAQVRELEQWGHDASLAKALLRIYEESHAMSILDRRRLSHALASAMPSELLPVQDNDREFIDAHDMTYHREAA